MYKGAKSQHEEGLSGHDREAILAGKIKNPINYENFKEEAYKIGALSLKNDPTIKDPVAFLMRKYSGNREKIRTAVIAEGKNVLSEQLRRQGALEKEMERLRKEQVTRTGLQSLFARNLIAMLEEKLGIDEDDEIFEVRFYSSAKDKMLDYVGGIDCWVELYDKLQNKVVSYYTIDLTYDPKKMELSPDYQGSRPKTPLSDTTYFYDPEKVYIDDDGKEKISRSLFDDLEFRSLVKAATADIKPVIENMRFEVAEIIRKAS